MTGVLDKCSEWFKVFPRIRSLNYGLDPSRKQPEASTMAWSKPEYEDLRFGFEITMYIMNR